MCMCKCVCMRKCMCCARWICVGMGMCMCCARWICVGMGKDHMGMAAMAASSDGALDAHEKTRAARRRHAAVTYRFV